MKNYKLCLSYDGSRYRGWQKQGNTPGTLQEKLEVLLSRLLLRILSATSPAADGTAFGQSKADKSGAFFNTFQTSFKPFQNTAAVGYGYQIKKRGTLP